MADAGETSIRVFLITGVIALLGFVALGLWYLLAPGAELDRAAGDYPDRAEVADYENEAARDSLSRQLVLSRYDLERAPAIVSGTVVNNTDNPFVNVQVGFRLLGADSSRVGTVRDTTSIVEVGETWNFRISLPPGQSVASIQHYDLRGEPKAPLGPNARTVGRPEEEPDTSAPADGRE